MQADHSESITYAIRIARRYYPAAFRLFAADAKQTATLAALQADFSTTRHVGREVRREMNRLMNELMGRREDSPGDMLRRRCARAARRWEVQQMLALGVPVDEVASRTGYKRETVTKLSSVDRTPEEVSALRAVGGVKGGKVGAIARWGADYEQRRSQARAMRASGSTLKQIAEACGYKSISAAHYAVAERKIDE